MMIQAIAAGGLLAGVLSLFLNWRHRSALSRDTVRLRDDVDRRHRECLEQIAHVGKDLATFEKNAQLSLESLRNGRPGMPARARALRMLRSGMSADSAAAELGLAKCEVRLLEKVAVLLAPRN